QRGRVQLPSRLGIPQQDGLVVAAGGEPLAVRREGERVDRAAVPGERRLFTYQRLGVPELDRVVLAARHERPAVGQEDDGVDVTRVPFYGRERRPQVEFHTFTVLSL